MYTQRYETLDGMLNVSDCVQILYHNLCLCVYYTQY